MIRRTVLAVAAAAALTVAPSAAFAAYTPSPILLNTDDPAPEIGQVVTANVLGVPGGLATLQVSYPDNIPDSSVSIAGAKSASKTIPASGSAPFTLTFAVSGTYTLTPFVNGVQGTPQTLVVPSVLGNTGNTGNTGAAAGGSGPGSVLTRTGAEALPYALGAAGLILAGGAVLLVRRRAQASAQR